VPGIAHDNNLLKYNRFIEIHKFSSKIKVEILFTKIPNFYHLEKDRFRASYSFPNPHADEGTAEDEAGHPHSAPPPSGGCVIISEIPHPFQGGVNGQVTKL
jgi:hypothetical protein